MWREILKIALREIARTPLRSILTCLGIVIGVASVITMVTIGSGATLKVQREISKMGTNLLTIRPGQFRHGGVREEAPPFKLRDVQLLQRQVIGIRSIAPASSKTVQVVYGNKNWATICTGTHSSFLQVRNWELESGRAFDVNEEKRGEAVCLIGQTVKSQLFGHEDPIGNVIRIKSVPFRVIGVLKGKGISFGFDADDTVIVPLKTFQRRIAGNDDVNLIYLSVEEGVSIDRVKEQIREILREQRKLGPNELDNFEVRDARELLEAFSGTTRTLTLFLGAVAAVSLLVGGIGIMNIMLVSITERTREIGLRLALGATQGDIIRQFLMEAIILSTLGGLIGLGVALGASLLLCKLLLLPFVFRPEITILAFGVSFAIGVFFGFFPARKAAHLNPIEALRHE
jgi:putative ABC transport system permease protein